MNLSVTIFDQVERFFVEFGRVTSHLLVDAGFQVVVDCLAGHGPVQIAGHQSLGQRFLSVMPHQFGHVLPLGKDSPDQQLVEWMGEQRRLQIIELVNN